MLRSGWRTYKLILMGLLSALVMAACASSTSSLRHDRIELENTRIWTFHKAGSADTSMLYGTMHVQDERAFVDDSLLREWIPRYEVLAIEIHPDSIADPKLAQLIQMQDANLADLLDSADYKKLDSLLRVNLGSGVESFATLQPLFVSTLLSAGFLESDRAVSLDEHIASLGREAGLELHGLETPREQVAALSSMSIEDQTEMLVAVINNLEEQRELSQAMINAFERHDLHKLDSVMTLSTGDTEAGREMYTRLFLTRNKIMLERMVELLPRGKTFIAVGAGHLSGRGGLIDLLRRAGFIVQAVEPRR